MEKEGEGKGHYKEWRKRERERGTIRNGEREGKGHYKEWRKRERERGTIRNGERGRGKGAL